MDPLLRVSLLSSAVMSVFGGAATLVRLERERWSERAGFSVLHAVSLAVAFATWTVAVLGEGDGRPLMLCVLGPLIVFTLHDGVTPRAALWSVPLIVTGLIVHVLVLVHAVPATPAGAFCGAVTVAVGVAGAAMCIRHAQQQHTPRVRVFVRSQAAALATAACAGVFGCFPADVVPGLWAVALGAACALGTAGRLQPAAPPALADVATAAAICVLLLCASSILSMAPSLAVFGSVWMALTVLGIGALMRACVVVPRTPFVPPATQVRWHLPLRSHAVSSADVSLPSAEVLSVMAPLLDDALLRRPHRPRVVSRVPARRVLDSAMERVRTAQPGLAGHNGQASRVEVVASAGEVECDGDPVDLAEALSAVLDNAFRLRATTPDVHIRVSIRSTPRSVTFEVVDGQHGASTDAGATALPDPNAPFMNPRLHDVHRPGLGLGLARARLLVERNGGVLLTHVGAEGSTVEMTVPRRTLHATVGHA